MPSLTAPKEPFFSFYNPKFRALIYQIIVLAFLGWGVWWLWQNTLANMREKNIRAGFDFLNIASGFDIGESIISYSAEDSYLRAIAVGFLNTLRVAIFGCVLATVIGTTIGIGRLSSNFLIKKLCAIYVEVIRNVPPLVHLLAWYFFLTSYMPDATHAIHFGEDIYLSQGGLKFPYPIWHPAWGYLLLSFAVGVVASFLLIKKITQAAIRTGKNYRAWPYVLILTLVIPAVVWQMGGAPTEADIPRLDTFGYIGGGTLTPEFLTLIIGLTIYTSCYIAEIVRSGIQAVAKGQSEASAALGLTASQRMRLVILPQALRVIIPPMTNQYLNLTKNSSLGVAVGYPEIVNVLTTTQNQTGQAVECVALIALVYLTISLVTSLLMNWYNSRLAFKTR